VDGLGRPGVLPPIPSTSRLEVFVADNNAISGGIQLQAATSLRQVRLSRNNLTVPCVDCLPPNVEVVDLTFCTFGPTTAGFLVATRPLPALVELRASYSGGGGTWPNDLAALLPSVRILDVEGLPRLTGTVTVWPPHMRALAAAGCTGLATSLTALPPTLTALDVRGTPTTGTLDAATLAGLPALTSFAVSYTNVLPAGGGAAGDFDLATLAVIPACTSLAVAGLPITAFTCSQPAMRPAAALVSLDASSTQAWAGAGDALVACGATALQSLSLADTGGAGAIPAVYGRLPSLRVLDVSDNAGVTGWEAGWYGWNDTAVMDGGRLKLAATLAAGFAASLRIIRLSGTGLAGASCTVLTGALAALPALEEVHAGGIPAGGHAACLFDAYSVAPNDTDAGIAAAVPTPAFRVLERLALPGWRATGPLPAVPPSALRMLMLANASRLVSYVPDAYAQLTLFDLRGAVGVQQSLAPGAPVPSSDAGWTPSLAPALLPSYMIMSVDTAPLVGGGPPATCGVPRYPAHRWLVDPSFTNWTSCVCAAGLYGMQGRCTACPAGTTTEAGAFAATIDDCLCGAWRYRVPAGAVPPPTLPPPPGTPFTCAPCPSATYAAADSRAWSCTPAPAGALCLSKASSPAQCYCSRGAAARYRAPGVPDANWTAMAAAPTAFPLAVVEAASEALNPNSDTSLQFLCLPCAAGTWKSSDQQQPCVACQHGMFSGTGASGCMACVETEAFTCMGPVIVFHPGWYGFDEPLNGSLAGVQNGHCFTPATCTSAPGYGVSGRSVFERCGEPEVCTVAEGGQASTCAAGHGGVGCGTCVPNWRRGVAGLCQPCAGSAATQVGAALLTSLAFGVAAVGLAWLQLRPHDRHDAYYALRVAFDHLQATFLAVRYFPAVPRTDITRLYAGLVYVDASAIASFPARCLLPPSPVAASTWVAVLLLGFALGLLPAITGAVKGFQAAARGCRPAAGATAGGAPPPRRRSCRARWCFLYGVALLHLCTMLTAGLTRAAIDMLLTVRFRGEALLLADTSVLRWAPATVAAAAVVPTLAVLSLFVPLGAVCRRPRSLAAAAVALGIRQVDATPAPSPATVASAGFRAPPPLPAAVTEGALSKWRALLPASYVLRMWQVVVGVRAVALAVVVVTLRSYPSAQLAVWATVLGVVAGVVFRYTPVINDAHAWLEVGSAAAQALPLLLFILPAGVEGTPSHGLLRVWGLLQQADKTHVYVMCQAVFLAVTALTIAYLALPPHLARCLHCRCAARCRADCVAAGRGHPATSALPAGGPRGVAGPGAKTAADVPPWAPLEMEAGAAASGVHKPDTTASTRKRAGAGARA